MSDLPPVAVPPRAGRVLELLGVRHRLTEEQTGGACYFFESEFDPGQGNRLHVHRYDDEIGYVIEGALAVRVPDEELEVAQGGIAFLPKNIPHAIRNPLATRSKYLFAAIPGVALEHWFEAVQAAATNGAVDDEVYRQLALEHGIEWLE